jgi:hypothetical protein
VLRYQSGTLIQTPYSNKQLNPQLPRTTPTNRGYVPGVNWLAVDPNCGCFNSQTTLVPNSTAWTDGGSATFGGVRFVPQPAGSGSRRGHELWTGTPACRGRQIYFLVDIVSIYIGRFPLR